MKLLVDEILHFQMFSFYRFYTATAGLYERKVKEEMLSGSYHGIQESLRIISLSIWEFSGIPNSTKGDLYILDQNDALVIIEENSDHQASVLLLTKQMNWQNKQSALTCIVNSAMVTHHMNWQT